MPSTIGIVASASVAFSPLQLSPTFWLDASDTSTITASGSPAKVSQWNDKSTNAIPVVQGTASAQPSTGVNTINGLNAISFDGNDSLASTTVPMTAVDNWAIAMVFQSTNTLNNRAPLIVGTGGNGYGIAYAATSNLIGALRGGIAWHAGTIAAVNGLRLLVLQRRSGTMTIRVGGVNGGLSVTAAPSTPTSSYIVGQNVTGYVGECVGWLNPTDEQVTSLENYLKTKWATP